MEKIKKMIVVLAGSLLYGSLLVGCGSTADTTKSNDSKTEVSSGKAAASESSTSEAAASEKINTITIDTENGTYEAGLLDGWQEIDPTEVNDYADFALENAQRDMYFMILAEPADDYTDFEAYAEMYGPEDMTDTVLEEEEEQQIDDGHWKGTRYSFTGEVDGVKVFYIYDIVSSENGHFAQRVTWTTNSRKEKNREAMEQTIDAVMDISE